MPSTRKRARSAAGSTSEAADTVAVAGGGQQWAELASLWRAEQLLDCTVEVEGHAFHAHRVVLSASSGFLRGCFCGGLSESETASVTLEDVASATFEALLSWVYEGHVEVDESALPQLLEAAARLQVGSLAEEVEKLVVERIAPANAIDAYLLADALTRPALLEAARACVLASFSEAAAAASFTRLPLAALEALLASDNLEVKDEAETFTHLKRWVMAQQPAVSAEAQARLLGCVRFAHMELGFVQQHVNTDPLVATSPQNIMIVAQAFQQALHGSSPCRRIGNGIELVFSSPFDTNGVLYHIATDGGKRAYSNPHEAGLVKVSSSSQRVGCYDHRRFVHTYAKAVYNFTGNEANAWMAVDLGEGRALRANHYCLRSDRHVHANKLRGWELQGSNDGQSWATLRQHADDASLGLESMSVAAWPVEQGHDAYRHFRILQTHLNSSGVNNLLCCTGIELYGKLQRA